LTLSSLLRRFYYFLSPDLRLLVRKIYYLPADLFGGREKLVPPAGLIYTGRGDFLKVGRYWLSRFIKDGGLQPDHHILDIGCGIGRMAVPLTSYIQNGKYEGFDAVKQGIDWCQKNIQSKFPHFNFTYVDLNNDLYKSKGIDAAGYRFAYDDNSFDFAISISVFTHMVEAEVANYLKESDRVLKPGGILFATFFIVPDQYTPEDKGFSFPYDCGNYLLMDKEVRSANVAYRQSFLLDLCRKNGFSVRMQESGYWHQNAEQRDNDFQDILILSKDQ